MHPIVESKNTALADLCRRSGVKRLEVFGSAARGDFDPARSDIDFLVELSSDPAANPFDQYFALKDALETMFGRPVDLVSMGSIDNPYVRSAIERDRQLVYAE